jgi:4-amino-4-deoxy-L-arabinose transferase-like glycosyltransferase
MEQEYTGSFMTNLLNKKLGAFIILSLIVLLGTFLRFYKLGINPPSLDWDEVSLGYNAYSILQTGADEYGNKFPLSIRSFDDYKPALYAYLDIVPVYLFGLNEFAVRFPAAIFGSLTIIAVYFLTKEILYDWEKKKRLAVSFLASFFFAISPWHLQFSRAAFEGQIGLFFLIVGLLFFLKAFKNGNFFYLSGISFLLSLYSYHSFRLLVPLILVTLLIVFFRKILNFKKQAIILALILLLLSLPIWNSFLGAASGTGARLSMVTIFSDPTVINTSIERINYDRAHNDYVGELFHNRRVIYGLAIARGYLDHFNPDFLFIHGDGGRQHHAVDLGMLYLWDLPFILAGIYYLLKKLNRSSLILFIVFLLAPIPAAITTGTPHPVRAIGMVLGLHIFAAAGVIFLWEKVSLLRSLFVRFALIFIFGIIFIFNVFYYIHQYYVHTPIEYGYFWQFGYKEALNYAKENESKFKNIIMTYEYDQPYIYYLFYNKIDPSWYQKNWDYNRNGTVDRFKRVIGKYVFRNIDYSKDINLQDALLIGTPKEIPDNAKVIRTIKFPDGKIAFKIVKT